MSAFKMPPVEIGDVVLWFDSGDAHQQGLPAVVTGIGFDTIRVNIIDSNTYNFRLRDGVRHISDDRRKRAELLENGAWDYTPRLKALVPLLDELGGHKKK